MDDDVDFLGTVRMLLAPHWRTAVFSEPDAFSAHLHADSPFWEADVWLQHQAVQAWRDGKSPLARNVLDYWSKNTERFAGTRVCIVDYRLHDRTGLDVLRHIGEWRGRRMLVTGFEVHELEAAMGREALIDGFLSKTNAWLAAEMIGMVRTYQEDTDPRLDSLWRGTLNPSQLAALELPGVARDLESMCQGMVEHVVLGAPFGVLGLTATGQLRWLPLEHGTSPGLVTDTSIHDALGAQSRVVTPKQSFGFGVDQAVHGAMFELSPESVNLTGHLDWLRRQRS